MQHLNEDFLKELQEPFQNFNTFVETGTYEGGTVFEVANLFKTIHTIEVKEDLYNKTKSLNKFDNIIFHLGDSTDKLKEIIPTIADKCIFFLDGHYSSGITGKGTKDCPLNEEIDSINNLYKNEGIIIIDDFRLFGTHRNQDWSDINKDNILDKLKNRTKMFYHLPSVNHNEDRLVIHINSI